MKIGLYFGSFNPIHIGHLIIAGTVANAGWVDQVWMVVSPQNPLKPSQSLLNEYHRLHLVQLAVAQDSQLKAVDTEFHLPRPSYTIDTLTYLREKYPHNTFEVILGSDSFQNLYQWKNAALLLRDYAFIVYQRPGYSVKAAPDVRYRLVEAPLLDISSTTIRRLLQSGKSIRYLVPDSVREEIVRNGYYR